MHRSLYHTRLLPLQQWLLFSPLRLPDLMSGMDLKRKSHSKYGILHIDLQIFFPIVLIWLPHKVLGLAKTNNEQIFVFDHFESLSFGETFLKLFSFFSKRDFPELAGIFCQLIRQICWRRSSPWKRDHLENWIFFKRIFFKSIGGEISNQKKFLTFFPELFVRILTSYN